MVKITILNLEGFKRIFLLKNFATIKINGLLFSRFTESFLFSKISLFLSLQARKRVGVKKRREEVHSRRAQTEQSASQWLEERRSQELRRKTVGIRMGGRGDHVTLGGHVTGDDHMTLERATPQTV